MKGLILKDFYSLRLYGKTLLLMLAIYAAIGAFSDGQAALSGLVGVLCMILPITSFTYDKFYKWEEYACSLPLRREQIVLAKYIFTAILVLLSVVLSVVLSTVIDIITAKTLTLPRLTETLVTNYFVAGIMLIIPTILLPVIFKFGPDKGRVAMFAVIGGVVLLGGGIVQLATLFAPDLTQSAAAVLTNENAVFTILSVLPVVTLLLFVLSYFISCSIYKKREL